MKKILLVLGTALGCATAFSLIAILAAMGFSSFLWGANIASIGTGVVLFAIGVVGTFFSLYLCAEVYDYSPVSNMILFGIAVLIAIGLFIFAPVLAAKLSPEYNIVFKVYSISILFGAIAYLIKPILKKHK